MRSSSLCLSPKSVVCAIGCLALAFSWSAVRARDPKSFEQRITTKVLPNGLTLILCQRHDAPVFSYSTFVDAGDVNDRSGESGLAHMFEHPAFKGTSKIGTGEYSDEKTTLARSEAANNAYKLAVLVVGNGPEIKPGLEALKLGAPTPIDITIPQPASAQSIAGAAEK